MYTEIVKWKICYVVVKKKIINTVDTSKKYNNIGIYVLC